jgi:hypothetical protein
MTTERRPLPAWLAFASGIGLALLVMLMLGVAPSSRPLQIDAGAPPAFAPPPAAHTPLDPALAPAIPQATQPVILVQVTATADAPAMIPVNVTATPELSDAELERRARAAVEAMRQSTQHLQADMPTTP